MGKYIVHKTKRGWTWKLVAKNGEPVSRAGEPFATKASARRAAKRHKELASTATIETQKCKQ